MASVQLQVNVARGQLDTLIADVNKLNNQEIKLNVGKGGTESVKSYSSSVKQASKDTKELTGLSKILGDSLGNIVAKVVAWPVINGAVATMVRSFKDAVTTMKEVDSQLTNIQKVSDISGRKLKQLGDDAYDTASKYGVAAEEYLSSVYTFTKAGLSDNAAAMAEIATKTMLVGDTTAEVASKFLIATNAAWGYNGAVDKLSDVVDKADYVNNNYATDLEKLADGMPIVASTAANMNLSFEETIALLGTINSKTQETGRKTATAVRSFLIAVSGQVGEFVDDVGETYEVTTENIEALTDALKIYGNEAVKSAIETGNVINPMEALNSLAQAYKDGLLSDIELQEILIKVAGKMRYNQLVTIVKDLASETSTYRDILAGLENAAGTADAEVNTMLSSWEAKTQILKNTWTEFLTNFINSETVKSGLDILIAAADSLNGGFGEFAATTLIVFGALKMLPAVATMLASGFTFVRNAAYIMQASFYGISDSAIAASLGMTEAQVAATRLKATLGIVALAIGAVIYAFNRQKKAAEETRQYIIDTAEDSFAAYKNIQELKSAYETAEEGSDAAIQAANDLTAALEGQGFAVKNLKQDYIELTEAQKQNTIVDLEAALYARGEQLESKVSGTDSSIIYNANRIVATGEEPAWNPDILMDIGGGVVSLFGVTASDINEAAFGVRGILETYDAAKEMLPQLSPDSDEYEALASFINLIGTEVEQYRALQNAIAEANGEAEKQRVETFGKALEVITNNARLQGYGKVLAETAGKTDEISRAKFEAATAAIQLLTDTLVANGEISREVADGIVDYYNQVTQIEDPTYAAAAASGNLISALVDESGQLTDTAVQALSTSSALLAMAQAEAEAGLAAANADLSNLISQLNGVSEAAADAAAELALAGLAGAGAPSARGTYVMPRSSGFYESLAKNRGEWVQAAQNREFYQGILDDIAKINDDSENGPPGGGGGGGGSSGGGGGSAEDSFLAALEDEIDLLKSELALMRERGASEEDQIKKIQQIQEALHLEADYLRQIGTSQEEINELSKEWWSYQGEIYDIRLDLLKSELALMEEREDDTETQIAKAREIQAVLREQIDALKEIGASQTEINKLEKEWWEYENEIAEKTNKLAEDRLSLEEKILAVQEAQVALMNAQNERTVRMYNAATGQWEWTANPKDIQSAQEALDSANQDLSDFYNDHKELQPEADEMGASELLAGMALTVPDEMIPEIIGTNGTSAPATAKKLQEIFTSAGATKAMVMQSNIGTQNNGNVYYFGGISFTEAQAGSMTLKQLAEQSRILNIYSGAN